MKKIFEKSEILFAIIWIVIYIVGSSIFDNVSKSVGIEKSATLIFHAILTAVILAWIYRNKLNEYFGLCKPITTAKHFLFYVPLVVLGSCNLWLGVTMKLPIVDTICYALSMICVGFLEEIITRGFLFKAMCKNNVKSAIIVSSITFGIGHIVNLINGSGAELFSNACQVCYAMAFGFMFAIIFYRGKSLIPCIVTHSIINVLSAFGNETGMTTSVEIGISMILCIIAVTYTLFLMRSLPKEKSCLE